MRRGKNANRKDDFEAMSISPQLVIKQRKWISVKTLCYLTLNQWAGSRKKKKKKAFLISPYTNLPSLNHRTTKRLLFVFLLVWGKERKLHFCISELFETIVIYISISWLLKYYLFYFQPHPTEENVIADDILGILTSLNYIKPWRSKSFQGMLVEHWARTDLKWSFISELSLEACQY